MKQKETLFGTSEIKMIIFSERKKKIENKDFFSRKSFWHLEHEHFR